MDGKATGWGIAKCARHTKVGTFFNGRPEGVSIDFWTDQFGMKETTI